MQRYQFNEQQKFTDTFYTPTVISAQCFIGAEKNPDAEIKSTYAVDKFSQAYGKTNFCFRQLDKDITMQPVNTQENFKTSNDYPENDRPCNNFQVLKFAITKIILLLNLIE